MKVFPDAKLMWLHRSPEQAVRPVPSAVSFLAFAGDLAKIDNRSSNNLLADFMMSMEARIVTKLMQAREPGGSLARPGAVLDISHSDLLANPRAVAARVYELGLDKRSFSGPVTGPIGHYFLDDRDQTGQKNDRIDVGHKGKSPRPRP